VSRFAVRADVVQNPCAAGAQKRDAVRSRRSAASRRKGRPSRRARRATRPTNTTDDRRQTTP